MNRIWAWISGLLAVSTFCALGCVGSKPKYAPAKHSGKTGYEKVATRIEYPDMKSCSAEEQTSTEAPRTVYRRGVTQFWDVTLQDAIHIGLKNSKVLRDLGGLVLQSPDNVQSILDPAIVESDPQFGVEAALSAFDANWSTQAFFEKNDRAVNNQFFGGGTRLLKQDLFEYQSALTKRAATGTDFTVRHNAVYDFNNAPGNNTPNLPWETDFELEVRQPLLQGAGATFNRIAGPAGSPGIYNGVMLARINTDIELADFEMGVRDLVFDIETTYWELYYAYRDLDAKLAARDRALETWRIINSLEGRIDADEEAQAREQYYRLEAEVQNALNGRMQERSRATTFRGTAGVYANERRLRLLMGLPISDERLIRPSEEPVMAKVIFDWQESIVEAMMRRPELRRQKWRIKQRELELVAAKNFLLPQLDTIGRYRWRGLGQHLISNEGGPTNFESAFQNLLSGDFQEWQLGVEFTMPIGFRQAYAGVRNAKLQLARSHAIMYEQEREVTHDLQNSLGELERAHLTAEINYNRRLAAKQQLAALRAKADRGDLRDRTRYLDLILDAQRSLADAESNFFRSMAEYMLAIKQVHYNKGSLLDYNEVLLAEGPWPHQAYHDAALKDRLRMRAWRLENFVIDKPKPVSGGTYPQDIDSSPNERRIEEVPVPPSGVDAEPKQPLQEPTKASDSLDIPIVPPTAKSQPKRPTSANQTVKKSPPTSSRRHGGFFQPVSKSTSARKPVNQKTATKGPAPSNPAIKKSTPGSQGIIKPATNKPTARPKQEKAAPRQQSVADASAKRPESRKQPMSNPVVTKTPATKSPVTNQPPAAKSSTDSNRAVVRSVNLVSPNDGGRAYSPARYQQARVPDTSRQPAPTQNRRVDYQRKAVSRLPQSNNRQRSLVQPATNRPAPMLSSPERPTPTPPTAYRAPQVRPAVQPQPANRPAPIIGIPASNARPAPKSGGTFQLPTSAPQQPTATKRAPTAAPIFHVN